MSEALLNDIMKKFSSKDEALRDEVWDLLTELKDDIVEVTRQKSEFEEERSLSIRYKYPYEIEKYSTTTAVAVVSDLISILQRFKDFGANNVSIEVCTYKTDKAIVFTFDDSIKRVVTKVIGKD